MQRRSVDTVDRVKSRLNAGECRLGIWGTGFIGFSTMANFANEGIRCVGHDVDEDLVGRINDGDIPIDNLEYWLGFETEPLVEDGLMRATTEYEDVLVSDVPVHFLAIPTEKEGVPWAGALRDTVEKLTEFETIQREEPLLVIVESTLSPGMSEDVVLPVFEESDLTLGEDVFVGVAPRRDWFISPDKNLRTLPRVFGGQDRIATEYMRSVLEIVCENLVAASNHRHAELVKSIENAYRHVGITLANQLSNAYSDIDMREVLKLVGTKWNIPTYYPSIGTGGYCIPLSSQYVLQGTDHEEELSILTETIRTDTEQPKIVAGAIADRGIDSVAILGLAYKGDVKVDILSPTKPITDRLQDRGVDVGIHDPYYDDGYVRSETDAASIDFPDELSAFEAVLVVADHRKYTYLPDNEILEGVRDCRLVVDNHGIWADLPLADVDVEYYYTGQAGWLDPTVESQAGASQ